MELAAGSPLPLLEAAREAHRHRRTLLLLMAGVATMHMFVSIARPAAGWLTSLALALSALLALHACRRMARLARGLTRAKWILAAVSLSLWIGSALISFYRADLLHVAKGSAGLEDLILFLRTLPLLVAASIPDENEGSGVFLLGDVVQMSLAAIMAFLVMFPELWLAGDRGQPLSPAALATAWNAANLITALFLVLRFLGSSSVAARDYYSTGAVFTGSYGLLTWLLYHYAVARWEIPPGSPIFTALHVPFLLFVATLPLEPVDGRIHRTSKRLRRLALVVDFASPILLVLALVLLGAVLWQMDAVVGGSALALVLLLHGTRSGMLEMRYRSTYERLVRTRERLRILSALDPLTGVANRRAFDTALTLAWRQGLTTARPLSVAMIDVDHFKAFNDCLGHPSGDRCLQQLALSLRDRMHRPGELLARYGGEEFALILPATDALTARAVAESVRHAITRLAFPHPGSPFGTVTVSIGLATLVPSGAESAATLVSLADEALYAAKSAGRNQISVSKSYPREDSSPLPVVPKLQ